LYLTGKWIMLFLLWTVTNGSLTDGSVTYALVKAKSARKPAAVILDTQKGQGCSFAEKADFNHYMVITREMAAEAIEEIDRRIKGGSFK